MGALRDEADVRGSYPLGVSRPPLEIADLPTPEEVFGVQTIGARDVIKFAIGPSLIALGISIGSGEWLLGPLGVGQYGFVGIGWVITLSIILQTIYNIEHARYVTATGELTAPFTFTTALNRGMKIESPSCSCRLSRDLGLRRISGSAIPIRPTLSVAR